MGGPPSHSDWNMHVLDDLIDSHRDELITRCEDAAAKRRPSAGVQGGFNANGIPRFLLQLTQALRAERDPAGDGASRTTVASADIGTTAALASTPRSRQKCCIS